MIKGILRIAVLTVVCVSLSGCLTRYVISKLNEIEYTPAQVATMSNYGLPICKHRSDVKEESRNLCDKEIQNRLANHKMTDKEYSNYEMQIESFRENQSAAASQQMHEMIMQNQAIDAQQDAQMMNNIGPTQPVDVNVHHSY